MSSGGDVNKMEVVDMFVTPVANKTVPFSGTVSVIISRPLLIYFGRRVSKSKVNICFSICSFQLIDISKTISYISRGVELNQPRLIQRAIRQVYQTLMPF